PRAEPVEPPAPATFSTTSFWPRWPAIASAMMRPVVSAAPPGANGTMTVIGRSGNDWPCAADRPSTAPSTPAARRQTRRRFRCCFDAIANLSQFMMFSQSLLGAAQAYQAYCTRRFDPPADLWRARATPGLPLAFRQPNKPAPRQVLDVVDSD